MATDFIVIGAGAIGLATALELSKRGLRGLVIDRGSPPRESSWAGGGVLATLFPWDYSDHIQRLADYSRSLFPGWTTELMNTTGRDPEFWICGMLLLPPFDKGKIDSWRLANRSFLEFVRSSVKAPEIRADEGAVWLPDVAQVRNPRLVASLRSRLSIARIEVLEGVIAESVDHDGVRATGVITNKGKLHAGLVVLCAGAWSGLITQTFSPRIEVRPVKGEMLLFKLPPDTLSTIVARDGRCLIPRRDGHVLVGATVEEAGYDKSISADVRSEFTRWAQQLLPAISDETFVMHWAGLRPGSPGAVPYIGQHVEVDGFYVNTGHFRYGLTMAPGSAALIADLITGSPPLIDPAPYAVKASRG